MLLLSSKFREPKEARAKFSLCKGNLGKCLGDGGRLSRPCKTVEPEHALALLALQLILKL